jgi:hypothetical protein
MHSLWSMSGTSSRARYSIFSPPARIISPLS